MRILANRGASDPGLRSGVAGMFTGVLNLDTIDNVVRGNFHYRGENQEVLRTPLFMWRDWTERGFFEGDCDDVSIMFATILKVLGVPVRFVAIRYDNHENFEHVFIEAYDKLRAGWRVFDPTVEPGTDYHVTERMVESV